MKMFLLFLIFGASSAIHITCEFSNDWNWPVFGRVYTCGVIAMDFTDNSTHVTGYSGQHLAGRSSADVKTILISILWEIPNCQSFNLTTVPKGFLNIFPNFAGLALNECPINFLNGDELDEYPDLELWSLFYSNLTRVPGNFFASTPNMKLVGFIYSKIEAVGFGLLDGLQHLQSAFFSDNICIDQYATHPSMIPSLIEVLCQNCPDIEPETTTTSTTTTTNQPPKCEIDDLEDFVCGLEEEVEVLQDEVKELKQNNARIEILEESNESLKAENEEIRAYLEKLERIVLEIYSRPCAC